jgi:hypothetical protein
MTLAKAKAKVKHIYRTGIIYDRQNIFIVQVTGILQTEVYLINRNVFIE